MMIEGCSNCEDHIENEPSSWQESNEGNSRYQHLPTLRFLLWQSNGDYPIERVREGVYQRSWPETYCKLCTINFESV